MQFAEQEICRVTCDTWASVLDLEAEQSREVMQPGEHEPLVTGLVRITGDWEGTLAVYIPVSLARRVTSRMFHYDASEASPADVEDATGEIANILGGGIKSLLPGSCHLSLPQVADGAGAALLSPSARVIAEVGFRCDGEPFNVALYVRDDPSAAVGA